MKLPLWQLGHIVQTRGKKMQLQSKNGISCDYCSTQYSKDFEYYSIDMRDMHTTQSRLATLDTTLRSKVTFSFDLCTSCYNKLSQDVVKYYKPIPVGLICNLTGIHLQGDFSYSYVDITKVTVKVPPSGKADITVFPRELEFTISETAATEMVNKVLNCRQKAIQQWHAKSST